jgi:hypothetical protein
MIMQKDMYIIVEFSKKWEGISKNWGVENVLLDKVSSEPRWQFEGRKFTHEGTRMMSRE